MFQQRDLKGRWECVSRSETNLGLDEFLTEPCMGHHKGWLSEIKEPLPTCHLRWLVMKELHSRISFQSQEVLYGLFNHCSFDQSTYFFPIEIASKEDLYYTFILYARTHTSFFKLTSLTYIYSVYIYFAIECRWHISWPKKKD